MNCHCANGGNASTCDHVDIAPPDFDVENHGSVFALRPRSDAASDWLDERFGNGEETSWLGKSLVVEHRYIRDIVEGAIADGFTVR